MLAREDALMIGERKYRVFVYLESRYDCRVSIGRKGVHLRLSKYLQSTERDRQAEELLQWARNHIAERIRTHVHVPKYRNYREGDTLKLQGREFTVHLRYTDQPTSSGRMRNEHIYLYLSKDMQPKEEQKHKTYLVARLIGNAFQPQIAQRLSELNAAHFRKPVKKLSLRDNISNWGSCSWDGNIHIATRLLFAPPEVIDYILIHELAHLVEHNHSDRFWKLVEYAMPGYRLAEQWLDAHGDQCVF